MNRFKFIYFAIGVGLVLAASLLVTRGLPEADRILYDKACRISTQTIDQIWPGFELSEYPMAIRSGNKEFVIEDGIETSRRPFLPVLAATAYRVEDEINIFMPSSIDMAALGSIMEGIASSREMMFIRGFSLTQNKMSDEQYIGIMYHEALHAFQLEHHELLLFQSIPHGYDENDILELIIAIDEIRPLKKIYEEEMAILHDAVFNPNEHLGRYISIRSKRSEMLSEYFGQDDMKKIIFLENYYEKVEGTARYMEANVIMALGNQVLYDEYLAGIKDYITGKEKYYRSGMGMALIFDKLSDDWKSDVFTKPESLFTMLRRYE